MIGDLLPDCLLLSSYANLATVASFTASFTIKAYECYFEMDSQQLQKYCKHCAQNIEFATQSAYKAATFAYNNPFACARVAAQTV